LSGGAVTTEMMDRLFDEMVRAHAPLPRKRHFAASDAVDTLIFAMDNDTSRRVAKSRLSAGASEGASAAETAGARCGFPKALGGPSSSVSAGAGASGGSRDEDGPEAGDALDMDGEASMGEEEAGGLPAVFKAPSNALADFLVYVFYAFAFITIARPITLINLNFEDFSFPDLSVAENDVFFNLYVCCAPHSCSFIMRR